MKKITYKIVDCIDDDNDIYVELDSTTDLFKAEQMLCYYINHGHDAYLEY